MTLDLRYHLPEDTNQPSPQTPATQHGLGPHHPGTLALTMAYSPLLALKGSLPPSPFWGICYNPSDKVKLLQKKNRQQSTGRNPQSKVCEVPSYPSATKSGKQNKRQVTISCHPITLQLMLQGSFPKEHSYQDKSQPQLGNWLSCFRKVGHWRKSWDFPNLRFDSQKTEDTNNRKLCSTLRGLHFIAVEFPRGVSFFI